MKLVFLGSGAFGLANLRALIDARFATVLVVTQPPRRRGRGGRVAPTPVHEAAEEADIPVTTPPKVNEPEVLDTLRSVEADLFVVAEYGQILSQELLDIPALGAVNVHASLLPRHRGASPVAAAILAGDTETGITIQRMVLRLDAGPVLAERRIAIEAGETAGELTARLAPIGGALLVEVVGAYAEGRPPEERPQDESLATVCRRLKAEDARIDWASPAEAVSRLVRAMTPKPGAHTELARDPALGVVVREAHAVPGKGEPGVVVAAGKEGFDVATGDGLLRVVELVPAARRPMSGRDFVNGYRLSAGERFR